MKECNKITHFSIAMDILRQALTSTWAFCLRMRKGIEFSEFGPICYFVILKELPAGI